MLLNLLPTFRSLTASPAQAAIDMARREARRRLEAGGAALAPQGDAGEASGDFVLPADVDPAEVAVAIRAKLNEARERCGDIGGALNKRRDGKMVVRREVLQRLGGRRAIDQIVSEIRARRVLRAVRKYTG